jgi:hypothetical protein
MLTLNACATNSGNERIYHSFELTRSEFDGKAGVDRVQILDFLYGNPEGYASRNPPEYKNRGECAQGTGGYLNMPRKDLKTLYVKWLDKTTGKTHEVTLDLAKKLPKDFGENHRVFASFKQGQLYVYIVTPERRPETDAPEGPEAYQWRKNLRIYPE